MSKERAVRYDEEYKRSCAKLAFDTDQPISKTAKELGVNPSTLYVWVNKYFPKDSSADVTSNLSMEDEIQRLRKELHRVIHEREILKKATAYFAKITE